MEFIDICRTYDYAMYDSHICEMRDAMEVEMLDHIPENLHAFYKEVYSYVPKSIHDFSMTIFHDPHRRFFILKNDNVIVGYIYLMLHEPVIHIEEIYIYRKYRGKQIGPAVIQKLSDSMKDFTSINLNVIVANSAALSMYIKLGFSMHTMTMYKKINQ